MMKIGYGRVSTDGQSLEAQEAELRAAGVDKIFKEKASGAETNRPQLAKAIGSLQEGDVLVVTRLDRLAPVDKGFAQYAGNGQSEGRRLQVAAGYLGRHDVGPWQANADDTWWLGGI
jgi:DNA invertase Pin-like site-specific DNA recombinase